KNSPQEELWNIVRELEDTLEASLCDAASPPPIYRPASWDQIRAMHRSPHITIGAHTHTHRILAHCQETTVRKELERSLQLLKDEVGVERPLFSYPNGNHNEMTRRVVKELGFRCALTTENGFNHNQSDPFTMRRFSTGNSARYVDVTVSGTIKLLLNLRNTIRGHSKPSAELSS
ncbi:MAG: polysaccharide deacetylase family protein, partial [Verrucomicrobiota bacterium]